MQMKDTLFVYVCMMCCKGRGRDGIVTLDFISKKKKK